MIEKTNRLKYFMHFNYLYDKRVLIKLFEIALVLNIFDAITTYIGLKFFTTIVESNPFMFNQINIFGLEIAMIVKILVGSFLMLYIRKSILSKEANKYLYIFLSLLYLFVVSLLIYTFVANTFVILHNCQINP